MLKESVEEARSVMKSRNFHVRTDGSISHSLTTETVNYLLGSLTGKPNVTKEEYEKFAKMFPQSFVSASQEGFFEQHSESTNTVVSIDGVKYDSGVIAQLAQQITKIKMVSTSRLDWMLHQQSLSQDAVLEADTTEPLIVTPYKEGVYWVIEGLERVQVALNSGISELAVKVIPTAKLNELKESQGT